MTVQVRTTRTTSQPADPESLSRIGFALAALAAPVSALNPILPHVGPVSAFTAYSLLMFVYGVFHMRRRPPNGLRRFIIVFCIPILAITLPAIVIHFGAAHIFAEAVVVSGGVLITLGLIALPSTLLTIRAVLAGWLLASISTTVLAIIELTTGRHFGPSYLDANPGASKTGVVTVFFNPNNYAAFLTLTIPLLIAGAALATRTWTRRAYYLAAIASVPIMIATSSRFGVAALLLGVAVWMILRIRSHFAQAFVLAFALLGVVLVFKFLQANSAGEISSSASGADYAIKLFGVEITSDSSLVARWNLMLNGFDMIDRAPFGSGPGGYELVALDQGTSRMTFGMINPHNGAIEFLTQYGVILGAIAVSVTIALFVNSIRSNKLLHSSAPERTLASASVCMIACLPLIFSMHSTFLNVPHEWAGFATIAVVAVYLHQLRATKAPKQHENTHG
ncbi:O-antigen ligase family protein [Microbacterium panaciterrae]|uniref:O-antigen ligase-related domain-containing protein n=1 Tax=Microbacterium panaciterrae TaxID=985759 RepID=A0ABP8PEI6_9MICO